MSKKIVIVGGVAGGATVAARLRRLSEDLEIVMFEKDEYISFANCGLPYYIGDLIGERGSLLVQTVDGLSKKFNLDIRNFSEVKSIDRENKKVLVFDGINNKNYEESYDVLILSPGASPIKPPIKGLDEAKNIYTLRNIPDTDKIKNFVVSNKSNRATIIGGGFIGIEMAENFKELGLEVTLIEASEQVMAPFDIEMANIIHNHLKEKGIDLILKDGVQEFKNNGQIVVTSSGKEIETDIIILAIGIRPESTLAKESNLKLGEKGHILVDEHMRTSDENIYALGDVIEFKDYIYKEPMSLALASPANKQARIAANVIMGIEDNFKGFLGTSVAKIFDLTAASTGWNEKKLKLFNKKYDTVILEANNHAGYYPTAEPIHLKVLYEIPSGKVVGAQAIGGAGTEKRIDVISTAIYAKLTIDDLTDLELAYAPPYSSTKDPVNIAGYMGQNKLNNLLKDIKSGEIDEKVEKGGYLIDVREPEETIVGMIPGAVNISIEDLRDKIDEIPRDRQVYVNCQIGLRGYNACRILEEKGIEAKNVAGGYSLYREQKGMTSKDEPQVKLNDKKISCAENPDLLKKKLK